MAEDRAVLRRRILQKDKAREYDEEYSLDLLEFSLGAGPVPRDRAAIASLLADAWLRRSAPWLPLLIKASKQDSLAWDVLKIVVERLRERNPDELKASPLIDWVLDVALGKRSRPRRPRGQDPLENRFRDLMIAATIEGIRKSGDRPATSGEGGAGSICRLVAERVDGLGYEGVRAIWTKRRSEVLESW